MRTRCCIYLTLLVTTILWGQEQMTLERFRKIVATPGDTNALRPQLASLPFWRNAKCSIALRYQDGRTFNEECDSRAKTVEGRYIVYSLDSQYYKQTMYSITGYDENASTIRDWGLFGDTVTEATVVFDPAHKVSAWTSSYGSGFMEISVKSYSDQEMTAHDLVYTNGILFMTRDVKVRPTSGATKLERDGPANGSQPVRPKTNQPSAAAGSGR
jgi:hypothetical protein